jgi:biotin carboxyl carrier protein
MGDTVLILEAMKMENHILAPLSGVVSTLGVSAGQSVTLNQLLVEIMATKD